MLYPDCLICRPYIKLYLKSPYVSTGNAGAIIEAHEERISAGSGPGKGSIFRFTLP
ncbi:MAG: hypothetical protein M0Z61_00120 [Nitrospiraceae bacterium]|nr:hypothetical protein [Nitrospiraceae bacterium]